MKILIIEDENDLSNRISTYLTRENFIRELADDFNQGLRKIELSIA